MAAYDIAAWADFGVAVAGSAAALTGLLFVAVSINLERILSYPGLPNRAGQTLVLFATPLLVSVLVLVPGQSAAALGWQLVGAGAVAGAALMPLSRRRSDQEPTAAFVAVRVLPSVGVSLSIIAAGVSLVTGYGGGLLWLVPAVLVALIGGLVNAWVLLVEILR